MHALLTASYYLKVSANYYSWQQHAPKQTSHGHVWRAPGHVWSLWREYCFPILCVRCSCNGRDFFNELEQCLFWNLTGESVESFLQIVRDVGPTVYSQNLNRIKNFGANNFDSWNLQSLQTSLSCVQSEQCSPSKPCKMNESMAKYVDHSVFLNTLNILVNFQLYLPCPLRHDHTKWPFWGLKCYKLWLGMRVSWNLE